jgi:hypothetical protein
VKTLKRPPKAGAELERPSYQASPALRCRKPVAIADGLDGRQPVLLKRTYSDNQVSKALRPIQWLNNLPERPGTGILMECPVGQTSLFSIRGPKWQSCLPGSRALWWPFACAERLWLSAFDLIVRRGQAVFVLGLITLPAFAAVEFLFFTGLMSQQGRDQ